MSREADRLRLTGFLSTANLRYGWEPGSEEDSFGPGTCILPS